MKIIIITQEDSFVIPQNIEKVIKTNGLKVIGISSIESKFSLVNKKSLFIRGFGVFQTIKIGCLFLFNKSYNFLDILTKTQFLPQRKSLKSVAMKYNIPYFITDNPNNELFINKLKVLKPDILVSFSAPVVFKEKLLKSAPNGCINLHCSYLPNYAGLMPSFWVLYKNADYAGASVHYMDTKIDNGPILGQIKIFYERGITMFKLIKLTKTIGGDLMCKVLKQIKDNSHTHFSNHVDDGSYFSWPTIEAIRDFRKKGGKLI
jgi:methionyl-tRNA formyltransferase